MSNQHKTNSEGFSNDEGTSVRARGGEPGEPSLDTAKKASRVDEKLEVARRLLARLPEQDRRARLLHTAIVRRDEVLLDGVIQELSRDLPKV